MKIEFKDEYISIKNLSTPKTLPELIILTGLNGSGKTHLLEAINTKSIAVIDDSGFAKTARLFDYKNLEPKDEAAITDLLEDEKELIWQQITTHSKPAIENLLREISLLLSDDIDQEGLLEILNMDVDQVVKILPKDLNPSNVFDEICKIKKNSSSHIKDAIIISTPTVAPNTRIHSSPEHILRDIHGRGLSTNDILDHIEENSSTPLALLKEEDVYNNYPLEIQTDPFQRSFSQWFIRYLSELKRNELRKLDSKIGLKTSFLSNEEFFDKHGYYPWDFVNQLFEKAELSFKITKPSSDSKRSFQAELFDEDENKIEFGSLSSGEKIIMSLAIALSYAGENNAVLGMPNLLLLDEIDAPLHPSMTNFLMKVIEDVIVKKSGVSVIMTTHSPSTIALAPEESIFQLRKKATHKFLEKISKDAGILLLTSGVPTLSVSYKNRRQVFVESKYDADFYTKIYQEVIKFDRPESHIDTSLSFIPSVGNHTGNCDSVYQQVKTLRGNGVDTIFGVVDWDLKNSNKDYVYVLGENRRYSIENYLLDPILVGFLLFLEFGVDGLNLPSGLKASQMEKLSQNNLQALADSVLLNIGTEHNNEDNKIDCSYIGNFTVQLPKWFCHMGGHDLEKAYKRSFPHFGKYKNEPDLKNAVLNKVVFHYPRFLPMDFSELFLNLRS